MFDLVINDGLIIGHDGCFSGSIAIKSGRIVEIPNNEAKLSAREVIDASGKVVFPGMIDCHVHFNEPGFEWREDFLHGTQSAAAGGVTTVVDMPLQNEPAVTTQAIFDAKAGVLKDKAIVDYALWGGLVDNNIAYMEGLHRGGAVALKAFLSPVSPDYSRVDTGLLREALKRAAEIGALVGIHCEDASIIIYEEQKAKGENRCRVKDYLASRPVAAELLAVKTVIELAQETGAKVHICHISHPEVAEMVKQAQEKGLGISAETCPHYLIFNDETFIEHGPLFKCAPPLRSRQESERLWDYLLDGTIGCIASDHSPCALEEKEAGETDIWQAWAGISGVQTTLQIMFDQIVYKKKLSPDILAKVFSYKPAKIFGLYPQKGALLPGSDADMIIVDPNRPWEIRPDELFYKNKLSAFVGSTGRGSVEQTIVRGRVVFEKGRIKVNPGYGCLIKPNL